MGENKIDIIDELVQEHVFIEQVMRGSEVFLFQDLTFTSDQIDTLVFIPKFFDLLLKKFITARKKKYCSRRLPKWKFLKQGGPKCVLFMGLRIEHQFGEKSTFSGNKKVRTHLWDYRRHNRSLYKKDYKLALKLKS